MVHPGCVLGLPISCHYGELQPFKFPTASASTAATRTRNYTRHSASKYVVKYVCIIIIVEEIT